jgi:hypothetical protein
MQNSVDVIYGTYVPLSREKIVLQMIMVALLKLQPVILLTIGYVPVVILMKHSKVYAIIDRYKKIEFFK